MKVLKGIFFCFFIPGALTCFYPAPEPETEPSALTGYSLSPAASNASPAESENSISSVNSINQPLILRLSKNQPAGLTTGKTLRIHKYFRGLQPDRIIYLSHFCCTGIPIVFRSLLI